MSEPQAAIDRQWSARYLLQHPMTCAERDPDAFRLIRRHEQELDRWFTQRLGYRLHVTADTARLFKSTTVPDRRPLMTATSQPRPLAQREYVFLCLALAALAAGPRVISLRDLIDRIRTAAVDADVALTNEASERRALVTAVQWLIAHGLARELHERVEHYVADETADAVLEVNPDRVALLPLPVLMRSDTASDVTDRSDRRAAARQWMRARLVEDPVLYRTDVTDDEWSELRRRLGEEADMLSEMFGLVLEVRAEGVAAVDASGELTDRRFPTTGTVGHAALLLIERLTEQGADRNPTFDHVIDLVGDMSRSHRRQWSKLAEAPAKLADAVLTLLADHRLVRLDGEHVEVLPLAHRFAVTEHDVSEAADGDDADGYEEPRLW